jgi:6-phosphogluconolactonase
MELSPSGRFLYAANRGHDSIACFAVDEDTGQLTALGQTPTEATPRSFQIEPDGQFLIAAGQGSGKLALFSISDAGALTRQQTYDVGEAPWWVQVVRLPGV